MTGEGISHQKSYVLIPQAVSASGHARNVMNDDRVRESIRPEGITECRIRQPPKDAYGHFSIINPS